MRSRLCRNSVEDSTHQPLSRAEIGSDDGPEDDSTGNQRSALAQFYGNLNGLQGFNPLELARISFDSKVRDRPMRPSQSLLEQRSNLDLPPLELPPLHLTLSQLQKDPKRAAEQRLPPSMLPLPPPASTPNTLLPPEYLQTPGSAASSRHPPPAQFFTISRHQEERDLVVQEQPNWSGPRVEFVCTVQPNTCQPCIALDTERQIDFGLRPRPTTAFCFINLLSHLFDLAFNAKYEQKKRLGKYLTVGLRFAATFSEEMERESAVNPRFTKMFFRYLQLLRFALIIRQTVDVLERGSVVARTTVYRIWYRPQMEDIEVQGSGGFREIYFLDSGIGFKCVGYQKSVDELLSLNKPSQQQHKVSDAAGRTFLEPPTSATQNNALNFSQSKAPSRGPETAMVTSNIGPFG